MFHWVLSTPQDLAIVKRYFYHDFLSISELQKCCNNDLYFALEKLFFKETLDHPDTELLFARNNG